MIKKVENLSELLSTALRGSEPEKILRSVLEGNETAHFPMPHGLSAPLLLAFEAKVLGKNALLIFPSEKEAELAAEELSLLLNAHISYFPAYNSLLYRGIAPSGKTIQQRRAALTQIATESQNIITTTCIAASERIIPRRYFEESLVSIKKSDTLPLITLGEKLAHMGYSRVTRVSLPGEFALRGEVLDVFSIGAESPVRILEDFSTVQSIRKLGSSSEALGSDELESCFITPIKNISWSAERITAVRESLTAQNADEENIAELLSTLSNGDSPEAVALIEPLAFKEAAFFSDWLSAAPVLTGIFRAEAAENALSAAHEERTKLFKQEEVFTPLPENLEENFKTITTCSDQPVVIFHNLRGEKQRSLGRGLGLPADLPFYHGPKHALEGWLEEQRGAHHQTIIVSSMVSTLSRLFDDSSAFPESSPLLFVRGKISTGASFGSPLLLLSDAELFGTGKFKEKESHAQSEKIGSFVDLNPGDYVVHVSYGIGIFRGIERMSLRASERDYIVIEYGDEEKLFVPIEQVNLVQRYIGSSAQPPHLDKMGSPSWERKKSKARARAEQIADELVELYSSREQTPGVAFPPDNELQRAFEEDFPYEATTDQLRATEEIKQDMESSQPMDRLLCGDVGFGKTEVAMRAIFKAALGGYQSALLCPTTILAEQHYKTLQKRMARFSIKIGLLSRFVSAAEQKKVVAQLAQQKIDVIVGTHRILSSDITFKRLGLLVVDEEQRFGVKHKEKLKNFKLSVDVLTMTATPIPRTLHMSLLSIRNISLLEKAPAGRHPIETFVEPFEAEKIKKAIETELGRGGQVFYLHNRIKDILETAAFVQSLIPEAKVGLTHGAMPATEIENVMRRIVSGELDVLITTTIIENGIDIPNVNTIIIDRADMYGISQLYQLRGRVGRSSEIAYAYLMYPNRQELSQVALKRLEVISDFSELGDGFKVAMKDMEIRGVGNLLGAEQSGEIEGVGFDFYVRMLNEAIEKRQGKIESKEDFETVLDLDYSGFIPSSYAPTVEEKMELYKTIAAVTTPEEFETAFALIYDRFGPPPEEIRPLFELCQVRIIAQKLSIKLIKERNGVAQVQFVSEKNIPTKQLMKLLTEKSDIVKVTPTQPTSLMITTGELPLLEKGELLKRTLSELIPQR